MAFFQDDSEAMSADLEAIKNMSTRRLRVVGKAWGEDKKKAPSLK